MKHIVGPSNTPKLAYVSLDECPEKIQLAIQAEH